MSKISRRRVLMLSSVLWAGMSLAQAALARPLVFGLITPRAAQQTLDNWRPLADRMGTALQMPVELRAFAAQGELVEAFRKGEIDIGWMGNSPALDVVEAGVGSVFAQSASKAGSFGYKSILIVPRSSTLVDLNDVLRRAHELRFGDGDPKSTSGHLVPSYFAFRKNGINDVNAIFKKVTNASHQKNLTLVAKGELDVATTNNEELGFFMKDFPELGKDVRFIWESPLIPQSPLVWKNSLPAETRRRIQAFTNEFGSKGAADELRILEQANNMSRFRQSSNLQLVPIADLEMFKARQAIDNDPSLSADERARRIDAVIRRASKLDLMLKLSTVGVR